MTATAAAPLPIATSVHDDPPRMPAARHRLRRLRLVGLLAALMTTAAAAEPAAAESATKPHVVFEGQPSEIQGFTATYVNGFVARYGDVVLLGDAVRYDLQRQDLYAEGRVVLVLPAVRIHAERLGMHLERQSGEAWGVVAWIETEHGRVPVRAEHVRFDRREMVFSGVQAGRVHGGNLALGARSIRVMLREKPDDTRNEPARHVRGIVVNGPYLKAFGAPVLWLPWLYRDFTLDYPWTRFRFGDSSRLGTYLRAQIGTSLPEVFGVHTRVEGRFDTFSHVGEGWGALGQWQHDQLGQGQAMWYGIEPERVISPTDNRTTLTSRNAHVVDTEHRARLPGGALYGRYITIPDSDFGPGTPPDERFRADFLREDLEHRPFARQGAAVAWGGPLGTVVVDSERRPNSDLRRTDRLFGVQAEVPDLELIGPLHASTDGWVERLRRDDTDTQATRVTGGGALSGLQWLGGVGLDAEVGARGLLYANRRIAGVDAEDDEWQAVPYVDSGVQLRLSKIYGGGIVHRITPRVGVQIFGRTYHDTLDTYGFGDPRDQLESDAQYLTTGFTTNLTGRRDLFRAEAVARWALREQDRTGVDLEGAEATSDSDLVDVTSSASGYPIASLRLDADAVYDARFDTWTRFDAGARWQAVAERLTLVHTVSYNPLPDIEAWEQRPGFELSGNRYDLMAGVSLRPGGDPMDSVRMQLGRRLVEGRLTFDFELVRDADGNIYDQRYGMSFTTP